MKTQERPLEVDFRLVDISLEVSRLLAGRYRLLSQLVVSNDVFEGGFWGEIVGTISHSLDRSETVTLTYNERQLLERADGETRELLEFVEVTVA